MLGYGHYKYCVLIIDPDCKLCTLKYSVILNPTCSKSVMNVGASQDFNQICLLLYLSDVAKVFLKNCIIKTRLRYQWYYWLADIMARIQSTYITQTAITSHTYMMLNQSTTAN